MARWVQQSPAHNPKWWANAMSAFDDGRDEVVVFGGAQSHGAFTFQNDTYIWDGTDWTLKSPTHKPSARVWAAMDYLPGTGVVLFGGEDNSGLLNDTWLWDGTDWTQLSPAHSPSAREGAMMAYHAPSGGLILFGGTTTLIASGNSHQSDTWLFDGTDWTQLSPATTPYGGYGKLMTKVANGNLRMGYNANATSIRAQWEWDGTDWTLTATGPSGPVGGQPTGAFHQNLGVAVMVTQQAPAEVTYVDDGAGSWVLLSPSPDIGNAFSAADLPFSPDKDGNTLLLAYNGISPTVDSTTTWILRLAGARAYAQIV